MLATVSVLLIAGLALTAGLSARQGGAPWETAKKQLAQIEMSANELGGRVLDAASSLAAVEPVETPTPTPTPVVVLALLPDTALRAATVQPDIVLAPTTVPGPVGGTALDASTDPDEDITSETGEEQTSPEVEPTPEPATATPEPTAAPPTATPTATEPPPTNTPPPTATPTRVPATATPEAVAAAAAATGGGGLVHSVQAGENWFTIARRYGVTQDALAAYNNRRPTDILQVGQALRIPPAGASAAVAAATPTPPRPTATAAPATPTSAPPVEIPVVARLSAPTLLTPLTGDGFVAGAQPVLTWSPVAGFGPQDYYYVLVRFTMRDGQQGYVEGRVSSPSFSLPMWVYDVASPPDRLAVWSVQVRRPGPGNQDIEISPPSENRAFYWR